MLTQDRYRAILDLLEEKNSVTVSELTKLLDSSESTIRRDLSALDEMGKLTKVFGGATSITRNEGVFEDAVSNRETVMSDEKDAVADLLALLSLGIKNIYLGPTLPAFLSQNVLQYLSETFGLRPISNAEDDLKTCLKQNV